MSKLDFVSTNISNISFLLTYQVQIFRMNMVSVLGASAKFTTLRNVFSSPVYFSRDHILYVFSFNISHMYKRKTDSNSGSMMVFVSSEVGHEGS